MATEYEWTLSKGAPSIFWSLVLQFSWLATISFPSHINRWTGLSIIFAAGYCAWQTGTWLSPNPTLNEIYLRYILIGSSYASAVVYEGPRLQLAPTRIDPTWSSWYRGWKTTFNCRAIGTDAEPVYLWPGVKHTQQACHSAAGSNSKPKSQEPHVDGRPTTRQDLAARGRWAGIAIRCGYILLNFLCLCVYYEISDPQMLFSVPLGPQDVTREKEGIVRRGLQMAMGKGRGYLGTIGVNDSAVIPVTMREVQIRALLAFSRAVEDYFLLSLYHDVCAVVALSIGLDESWEWPPLFGSITEAYSMRRYWGVYWHKLFYKSANSHASLVLRHVVGMQKSGAYRYPMASRILHAFLVFGLSAVMHSMVMARLGHPCAWGRGMWYWMLQPVAFVVEGAVQVAWAAVRRRVTVLLGRKVTGIFERLVGYVWVCAWLLWVSPKHAFPFKTCS